MEALAFVLVLSTLADICVHILINILYKYSLNDNFVTVQKERDSDESTDEESEEVEEVNADLDLFPHRCPKCGKRFKLLSNLAKHRKVANYSTIVFLGVWKSVGFGYNY